MSRTDDWSDGWAAGYEQALRDAVEAVSKAYDDPAPMTDGMTVPEEIAEAYGRKVMFEDAVAAIEALAKEDEA